MITLFQSRTSYYSNYTTPFVVDLRHGFNGMEEDDQIKGDGNSYDFGARMLDPRLGRWLTIDPHSRKYPDQSPYSFALNSPLLFNDPNGKDAVVTISEADVAGVRTITVSTNIYVTGSVSAQQFKQLNEDWNTFYGADNNTDAKQRQFEAVDASGNKYLVQFDVNFILATDPNNASLPDAVRTFVKGDVYARNVDTKAGDDPLKGEQGLEHGDNVLVFGWAGTNATRTEISTAWINDGEDPIYSAMHEIWHLLGLSDRYDQKIGKPRKPQEGYEKCIMGGAGMDEAIDIGQANLNAFVEASLKVFGNKDAAHKVMGSNSQLQVIYTLYQEMIGGSRVDDYDLKRVPTSIEGDPKLPGEN